MVLKMELRLVGVGDQATFNRTLMVFWFGIFSPCRFQEKSMIMRKMSVNG